MIYYKFNLYKEIVTSLQQAGNIFISHDKRKASRQIFGWNALCKESHRTDRESFLHWPSIGSPRFGPEFQQMNLPGRHFKLTLRNCCRDKDKYSADKLAQNLLSKNVTDFWKEFRKSNLDKIQSQAVTVGGVPGSREICDMWKEHYAAILNTAKDNSKKDNIDILPNNLGADEVISVTQSQIREAIKKLKNGKSVGMDKLANEHIKLEHDIISIILASLFNSMLTHDHVPSRLMDTIIISLLKGKKGDTTSKDNYRPIAITTAISKVLEIAILEKFAECLETTCHQFGFKKGLSKENCIFTLKEVINYYNALGW